MEVYAYEGGGRWKTLGFRTRVSERRVVLTKQFNGWIYYNNNKWELIFQVNFKVSVSATVVFV